LLYGIKRVWRGITNHIRYLDDIPFRIIRSEKSTERDIEIPDNCKIIDVIPIRIILDLIYIYEIKKSTSVELYLHIFELDPFFAALIAKLYSKNLVVICTGGEILHYDKRSRIIKLLIKYTIRLADRVLIKEPYMEDILHNNKMLSRKSSLIHINNGVIDRDYSQIQKISSDILCLDSFKKWRNIVTLIRAIKIIKERNILCNLNIVGARTKSELDYVNGLVGAACVEDYVKVHFFTSNPFLWFGKSSIFVLPADHVYANNALLESMVAQCVPIISDVKKSSDLVLHNKTGYIVELNSPIDLANRIIMLLNDDMLRTTMGKAARDFVLVNFCERSRSNRIKYAHKIL